MFGDSKEDWINMSELNDRKWALVHDLNGVNLGNFNTSGIGPILGLKTFKAPQNFRGVTSGWEKRTIRG